MKAQSIMMACCCTWLAFAVTSCQQNQTSSSEKSALDTFQYEAGQFADIQLLRYRIEGFDALTLQQKKLAYCLSQAALFGRDIIYDQKYRHNIRIRHLIEGVYQGYQGEKSGDNWEKFRVWAKRFWFSNGLHHHYANTKLIPAFSPEFLKQLVANTPANLLPLNGQTQEQFISFLQPILFDPKLDAKIVDLSVGVDNIKASANNYYEGVTQKEVEDFYKKMASPDEKEPVSYGLNSKLAKINGKLTEQVWKVGGMYDAALRKIVYWLEQALPYAENNQQKDALAKLITYYQSGSLRDWDVYNVAWVKDLESKIDLVNGFIEVYGDALGKKAAFESVLSMRNEEATKRIAAIAAQAAWFESNSPIKDEHKKPDVKGISAKVITVLVQAGDAAPYSSIGINLPNSNWIRETHGSKSVSLGNIVEAYNNAGARSPALAEFAENESMVARIRKYGAIAGDLHTDMHEVIGHASGRINKGVATPDVTLKTYANTLEEARADLVALYYIMDPKLVEIGVMPSLEVGQAEYDNYVLNGLIMQLSRIELGENLEEAHMRNRQLVAGWAMEMGKKEKVIEWVKRDGKTYVKINNYKKLRTLFGELLKEIQRIKSEGDYESARQLVESFGVKVDQALLKEVRDRYSKLGVSPYKGFIQPKLVPVMKGKEMVDVKVEYPADFERQMLEYGKEYATLK